MRPLIEFCVNNLTDDVLVLMKELEQNMDLDVIEYGCLGNCGICAEFPYALVNGEVVTGKDVAELRDNINQAINKMEVWF